MNSPGLTLAEVVQSRAAHGVNVLTPPERDPWWKEFLSKFEDPVIRILIIAAVISFGVGALERHFSFESLGIVVAILLATGLAFWNERKANAEFEVLNTTSDEVAVKVRRAGSVTTVPRKEVVVGDVVLLDQGDEVPADGRLLDATALEVNEAAFTGESLPAPKSSAADAPSGTYAANQLLRSTMVVDGHGTFVVEQVGDATQIGQIAIESGEESDEKSPLNRQLERLSKWIGVVGFAIAAGTFAALVARGALVGTLTLTASQWWVALAGFVGLSVALLPVWLPLVYDAFELAGQEKEPPAWLEGGAKTWLGCLGIGALAFGLLLGAGIAVGRVPASPSGWLPLPIIQAFLKFFMIAVTIIVVAVPEGLAMSVTLSLAYSMRRMTATNCLVRQMDACETIGAATHICSDKTGTLTLNEMRVQDAFFPGGAQSAALHEAMAINSTANLETPSASGQGEPSGGKIGVVGNPTEGALLLWLREQGGRYEALREEFIVARQWPFSTERKFMATLGHSANGTTLHVKGAPDIVLARCTSIHTKEGERAITSADRDEIGALVGSCSARAMRTLAFASKGGAAPDGDAGAVAQGLTWLGFVAIADPVRPEVKDAVARCHHAGIQVKIVTGDNPYTASEIARQIGLFNGAGERGGAHPGEPLPPDVMLGADFAALDDQGAEDAAQRLKILARARPADKLRLVNALARRDAVVAVTGDGTNDAPALSQAAVGLAMGKAGTAVAKEASDIILLDDSFGSIATAVKWGRALYLNIQKFILFQLTINVAACGIALLGPFIGVDLPLTVMQMLWVNLIMDTFAALALATEPPEPGVMDNPPRGADDFIVSPAMLRTILVWGCSFLVLFIVLLRFQAQGQPFPLFGGTTDAERLTIFFTFFVLLQFWNQFNARTLGSTKSAFAGIGENPYFLAIAAAVLIGQILIVSFGGQAFRVVPLSLATWATLLGATSLVLWIGEISRFVARARRRAVRLATSL